jgi:hypothetical protein
MAVQPGEINVSEEVLEQDYPGMKNVLLTQPQQAGQTVPSADKRLNEQRRINALVRERQWYREQLEVYAREVGNCVRGQRWSDVVGLVREAQGFCHVFGILGGAEVDDTTLAQRTATFSHLVSMQTGVDTGLWMEKWRVHGQMV